MTIFKRRAADGQRLSEKASAVEFWRFAFTVLVGIYHLEIYFWRREIFLSGVSAVEFFFIIAGFLMAKSAKRDLASRTERMTVREAHGKALEFVKKKLKAIYPILIAVMIIWAVTVLASMNFAVPDAGKAKTLMNSEWELLLLVGTPFGFNEGYTSNIPMWFLTMLLVVGYIYTYAVYRHYDFMMFAAPVIGVLFYIFFALCAPTVLEHGTQMGFLNAGTVRAVAEMSFGISLYQLYEYVSKKKLGIIWRTGLSLLELYAVYRLFSLMLYQPLGLDNYRRIVYVLIIVFLSFLNVTALSRLLNNRISRRLGGISLAMYLSHFCLIPVYFRMISTFKSKLSIYSIRSSFAKALSKFMRDTGGFGYGPAAMTWKDILIFVLMLVIVSVLILLAIAGIKRFIVRPLLRARAVRLAAADAEAESPA